MNNMLMEIKEASQDFEWYPTTREIIFKVCRDITEDGSLLDIGAGNGNVFKLIDEIKPDLIDCKYAIEKSEILINKMDKDIFVIGTDFHSQTLIDKKVDYIFCNPPYSEYKGWATKIIRECNCKTLYLVIPERWENSQAIKQALTSRDVKAKALGSFDFENSEYRKARAKVNIVKVDFKEDCYHGLKSDPFDAWFNETFKFDADKEAQHDYDKKESTKERIKNNIVKGNGLIPSLVNLYGNDMTKLLDNYRAVETLDYSILKELNIDVKGLKEGLKSKIKGQKNLYWQELFDNFEALTNRLIKKSRENLLRTLTSHTSIDFTEKNIYAVVIWAIKNANSYIDSQLLDVYFLMASDNNIAGYKSNKRFQSDEWKYLNNWDKKQKFRYKEVDRYSLDYRLVFENYNNFTSDRFSGYKYPNGLNSTTHEFINDIFTVAKNLGFDVSDSSYEVGEWSPGKSKTFEYHTKGDKWKTFVEIKAYKNGNIHCKFNTDFMKAFNIEAGRLNGWLRSPQEANEEMNITDAQNFFKTNIKLLPEDTRLLA